MGNETFSLQDKASIVVPGQQGADRGGGQNEAARDGGPEAGPSAQDMEVAGSLRTILHRLIKLLRRETRNEAQLSLTERSTLGLLYQHRELLPSDIARMEKVSTQSMSQVINHLFELSYIYKNPSAEDKRKVLLSLTETGKGYVEQLRLDKQEWLARALHEKTTPEEKELLMKAMTVLTKLIDE